MYTAASRYEKGGGSRARIIRLLLGRQLTIDAMARTLGVTRNAVRAQIALLQREGLVEPRGELKGARRPFALYGLSPGGDVELSRAYPSVLSHLVRVLALELAPRQLESVMRKLGNQIAATVPRFTGEARDRVRAAVGFLKSLGSVAVMSEVDDKLVISSDGCPIGIAVAAEESACLAMESMLQELTGLRVVESCARGAQPSCRFVITPSGKQAKRLP